MKTTNFTGMGCVLLWVMMFAGMFAGITWMAGMALDQVGVIL